MVNPKIFDSPESLTEAAADLFVKTVRTAVASRGKAFVALSGGSTPKAMHQLLTTSAYKGKVPWERLVIFWGDERCVSLDDAESNYRMAHETLLKAVPLPPAQVYPIDGSLAPGEEAERYQNLLAQAFGQRESLPAFDLILLGMGPDGHTASLFPGHDLLAEKEKWVAPVLDSPKPPPTRITFTLPLINAARRVAFLAGGESKAPVLKDIFLAGNTQYPAAQVNPLQGDLRWLIDQAAARDLKAG